MADLGWGYLGHREKDAILRGVRDGVAYGGPYHVEIHPSGRCNIDCFFCSTAALRGNEDFPLGRLQELVSELRDAGTRSVRLSGGGEPLFHRGIDAFLDGLCASPIRIENLTTNGVLLSPERAARLVAVCDTVTVSLNTADAPGYGAMMQTSDRNFERVLQAVRGLLEARRRARSRTPRISLQFLVHKDNYRTIPAMYRLARTLDVDCILFSGLAYLTPRRGWTLPRRRR